MFGLTDVESYMIGMLAIAAAIGYASYEYFKLKKKEQATAATQQPVNSPRPAQEGTVAMVSTGSQEAAQRMQENTIFPGMKDSMMSKNEIERIESMKHIHSRIQLEQTEITEESDQLLEKLEGYINRLKNAKQRYMDLANLIDTQYQIIDFDLEAKTQILGYYRKNKDKRDNLPAELEKINKSANTSKK